MSWGVSFRSAYAAASEQARLAARDVIERITEPPTARLPAGAGNPDATRAYAQVTAALARADSVLASFSFAENSPERTALQSGQVPTPHDTHRQDDRVVSRHVIR